MVRAQDGEGLVPADTQRERGIWHDDLGGQAVIRRDSDVLRAAAQTGRHPPRMKLDMILLVTGGCSRMLNASAPPIRKKWKRCWQRSGHWRTAFKAQIG